MPQHPSNLEKRGDTWWFRKRLDGRQIRRNLHTKSRRNALRLARDKEKELLQSPPSMGRETISAFGERWLGEWIANRRNEKGQELARRRFELHIRPELGRMKLDEVKRAELLRLAGTLRATGLAPQTIRHVLSDLRCLLRHAAEVEELGTVPSFRQVMPRISEEAPKRLSDDQVTKILSVLPSRHALTVRLGLLTGLRYGELHRLQWKHVVWGEAPHLVLEQTKSGKVRRVPLPVEAVDLLREAFASKESFSVIASRAKNACLIYHRSSERCGFRWHFHQLRHTFASRYLEAKGSPAVLKEILGHSTIRLTERYSRLSEAAVFAEARMVNLSTERGHQSGHPELPGEREVVGVQ